MHCTLTLSHWRNLLALFFCCWTASVCQAVGFTVSIDTTPLVGQTSPPAPFALEFQFNDGDGTVANAVTLSNFDFGGGTATGSPTFNCTAGSGAACTGISGDLSTTVTLSDSNDAFNEFVQGFTPGSGGPVRFLLELGTPRIEPFTPDAFSFAILDSSGNGVPTSFFDVFVQIDLTVPLGLNTYASDPTQSPPGCTTCAGIEIGTPTLQPATPVPLPTPLMLLGSGLALMRRRSAP